jgi:hypothetical protein
MEFPQKKNLGIKWSELMFLKSFIQDLKKRIILIKKLLPNLKDCSQFALNLSIIVPFSIRNSTQTIIFISIIGFQVGLELMSLQLEYLLYMSKHRFLHKIDDINSYLRLILRIIMICKYI